MKSLRYVPGSTDPGSDKNPCNLGIKIRRSRKSIQAIIKLTQYGSRRKSQAELKQAAYSIDTEFFTYIVYYIHVHVDTTSFQKDTAFLCCLFSESHSVLLKQLISGPLVIYFPCLFQKKINRVSLMKKVKLHQTAFYMKSILLHRMYHTLKMI